MKNNDGILNKRLFLAFKTMFHYLEAASSCDQKENRKFLYDSGKELFDRWDDYITSKFDINYMDIVIDALTIDCEENSNEKLNPLFIK